MDIEQSLIRNESFNDNEIRFFSETDEVVTAISSLYEQDQDQVVDDSSTKPMKLLMQTPTTKPMNFFHWRNLKRCYSTIKIKMLMTAAPTNLLLMQTPYTVLMNFLHWRNLKRAYSAKTMTIKCRQTVRHSRFRRQRQHSHALGIWIWNFLVSQ